MLERSKLHVTRIVAVQSLPDVVTIVGWGLFLGLACVELLALAVPSAGAVGVLLWYVASLYLFGFGMYCLFDLLRHPLRRKTWLTLLMIALYGFIVAINLQGARNLSGESTQEWNCALRQLTLTTDHGYHQTCLFGYPTRQFYVPIVPSLLFGRSMLALHVGGGLYFLLGLIVFASAIVRYFGYTNTGDWMNGVLLSSIFHVYFFNHFMFVFEQSIFPFSLGLLAVGLFLHYIATPQKYLLILLGLALLYLIYAYTPGLALVALGIVALEYLVVREKRLVTDKLAIEAVVVLVLFFLCMSLTLRSDIRIHKAAGETPSQLLGDLTTAFEHILFQNHGVPLVSPIYNFILIFMTVASLLFVFGARAAFVALWMVATIIMAVTFQGYAYYGIDFRLHRATVIFPVFFALLAIVGSRWTLQDKGKYLVAATLILGLSGIHFHNLYMQAKTPNAQWPFIQWLQTHVPLSESQPRNLYFAFGADQYNNLISLNDTLQYFIPELHSGGANDADQSRITDLNSLRGLTGIVVVPASGPGLGLYQQLSHQHGRFRYYGTFTSDQDVPLAVFEKK